MSLQDAISSQPWSVLAESDVHRAADVLTAAVHLTSVRANT
jgi:hypothetical protein